MSIGQRALCSSIGRSGKVTKRKGSRNKRSRKQVSRGDRDEEVKAAVQSTLSYYGDWFKRVEEHLTEDGLEDLSPKVYKRFQRFAKTAADDLVALAEQGVAPPVVVCLIFSQLMQPAGTPPRRGAAEMRTLSSHNYWRRGRAALDRADEFLSEFAGYVSVKLAAKYLGTPEFDPFVKVCQKGIEAAATIRELVSVIDELDLDKPGWTLRFEPGGKPLYRKTSVTGRKKSGRYREGEWDQIAAMLHEYFKRSTGKPHWAAIGRLLHFAGFRDFPRLILRDGVRCKSGDNRMLERSEYRNKIRARVKRIKKDPIAMYAVEHTLGDYEQMHEGVHRKLAETSGSKPIM
jgi:hypothetical protein